MEKELNWFKTIFYSIWIWGVTTFIFGGAALFLIEYLQHPDVETKETLFVVVIMILVIREWFNALIKLTFKIYKKNQSNPDTKLQPPKVENKE